ncbi:MAG: hypothetical protein AB1758_05960 [Candidatus Eremiobacterota bacterium]
MTIRPLVASGTTHQKDPLQGLDPATRQTVQAAVSSTASYKGRPWSSTEYNCALYTTRESIQEQHGPAAAAAFEELMARQPVRGGGFNPWSGD